MMVGSIQAIRADKRSHSTKLKINNQPIGKKDLHQKIQCSSFKLQTKENPKSNEVKDSKRSIMWLQLIPQLWTKIYAKIQFKLNPAKETIKLEVRVYKIHKNKIEEDQQQQKKSKKSKESTYNESNKKT